MSAPKAYSSIPRQRSREQRPLHAPRPSRLSRLGVRRKRLILAVVPARPPGAVDRLGPPGLQAEVSIAAPRRWASALPAAALATAACSAANQRADCRMTAAWPAKGVRRAVFPGPK